MHATDEDARVAPEEAPVLLIREHTHHDPEEGGNTCIECHMPKIVNHAEKLELRSHTRWSPDPAEALRTGMPDACTRCHEDRDQEWAAAWAQRWWGQGETAYKRAYRNLGRRHNRRYTLYSFSLLRICMTRNDWRRVAIQSGRGTPRGVIIVVFGPQQNPTLTFPSASAVFHAEKLF